MPTIITGIFAFLMGLPALRIRPPRKGRPDRFRVGGRRIGRKSCSRIDAFLAATSARAIVELTKQVVNFVIHRIPFASSC